MSVLVSGTVFLLIAAAVFSPFGFLIVLLARGRDEHTAAAVEREVREWLTARRKTRRTAWRPAVAFPPPKPAPWPADVVRLAAAFDAGTDCGFALHDALLEAGRPELAEAFRSPDQPESRRVVAAILDSAGADRPQHGCPAES